jgi:hypothetical protein
MSAVNIDQAFVFDFMAQDFGLEIAHDNEDMPSQGQSEWCAIRVHHNPERRKTIADLNQMTGVFSVVLYYPEGNGAMPAKLKAQEILDAYPVDRELSYAGQVAKVSGHWRPQAAPEDGWYKIRCEIFFEAFLPR